MPTPNTLFRRSVIKHHVAATNNLTFVQETFVVNTAAASSSTTLVPGNTAGNLLVAFIGNSGGSAQTVSFCGSSGSNVDPGGNTWARLGTAQSQGTNTGEIWYTLSGFVAGGSTTAAISCQEWSGAKATSPADIHKAGLNNGTAADTGVSAATAQNFEVSCTAIFFGTTADTISGQTAGYTPLTLRRSNTSGATPAINVQSAYLILNTTGTQEYAATISGAVNWVAQLNTFKSS